MSSLAALALMLSAGGTSAMAAPGEPAGSNAQAAATATAEDGKEPAICESPELTRTTAQPPAGFHGVGGAQTQQIDDYFRADFKTLLPIIKACDIANVRMDNGANNAAPIYEIELENGTRYWFFVPEGEDDQQALEDAFADKKLDVEYGSIDIHSGSTSPLRFLPMLLLPAIIIGVIIMAKKGAFKGGMGGGGLGGSGLSGGSDKPWNQIIGTPIRFNSVGGYPEVVTQLKDVLARYEANLENEKAALLQRRIDNQQKILDTPQASKKMKKHAQKELEKLAKLKAELSVEKTETDEIDFEVEPTNGVLFYGPPGTGKSLMAEAVAGEAGVPFLNISGSDFVNQLVGRGAANVRAMYAQAKRFADEYGGCIVFVDEVDSIAGRRGQGAGSGGDSEREATLNALLACMSGPLADKRIMWMAATNRKDMIDPAILRPGRLTEHVEVTAPKEAKGRKEIILIYAKKYLDKGIIKDDSVLDLVAGMTPGFTGADLKQVVNEAAVFAKKSGKKEIDQECFAEAILKTMIGIPFDSMDVPHDEHARVMAHEGLGHALATLVEPIGLDIFTVSARPRGGSMGHVSYSPEKLSKFLTRRDEMLKLMLIAAAGRAAEEVCYGGKGVTGGWSSDLQSLKERYRGMMDVGLLKKDISDSTDPRTGMTVQDREFRSDVIGLAVDTHRKLVELMTPEQRERGIEKLVGLGKRELIGEEATRFMMDEVFADYPWDKAAEIVSEFLNTSFDEEPLYEAGAAAAAASVPARDVAVPATDREVISDGGGGEEIEQREQVSRRRHVANGESRRGGGRLRHRVGDRLHQLGERLSGTPDRQAVEESEG